MKNVTTEFSFVLKPAAHGVGVFATHNIKSGTFLRLFGKEGESEYTAAIYRDKKDVPELFQQYCTDRGRTLGSPRDFGHMEIGWYLNHSKTPNALHKKYHYYASRDIPAGEEITIDYNTLEEPEDGKEAYY